MALYNSTDYTGKKINGYIILGKGDRPSGDTHVYWKCQCEKCEEIVTVRSSRIETKECHCQKDSISTFNNIEKSKRNDIFRGCYYKKTTGCYEVNISFNKKKYYLGCYEDKNHAINLAKISYSFQNESNLLYWFENYANVYDKLEQCVKNIFYDTDLYLEEFINFFIYDNEYADILVNQVEMERYLLECKNAYLDSVL